MNKSIKEIAATFFLVILICHQVKAEVQGTEFIMGIYIFLMALPVMAALLSLLLNLNHLKRALIIVFIIWFIYISILTQGFQSIEEFISYKRYDNPWIYWLPISVILLITIVLYLSNKSKKLER